MAAALWKASDPDNGEETGRSSQCVGMLMDSRAKLWAAEWRLARRNIHNRFLTSMEFKAEADKKYRSFKALRWLKDRKPEIEPVIFAPKSSPSGVLKDTNVDDILSVNFKSFLEIVMPKSRYYLH
ncbi:hypothetical protein BBP40_009198 [Aspergillus hancockii]|nr:hypothetical protein BBP40_009198 [Aspergillus hancockii]